MTALDAPEWALREACERANAVEGKSGYWNQGDYETATIIAHALTIAKHEKPPVTQEQRERVARVLDATGVSVNAQWFRDGKYDANIPAAIAAYRNWQIEPAELIDPTANWYATHPDYDGNQRLTVRGDTKPDVCEAIDAWHDDECDCDEGHCWNNADPTSGQWVPCENADCSYEVAL